MIQANLPELSYWENTQYFKDIDLLVVGSGIVGLSAAIFAKEQAPKLRVMILERGPLPTGASTRNAGFACFGSPSELIEDLETQSEAEVFQLVEKRWRGLNRLRESLGDEALAYREWGGYELFRDGESERFQACADQLEYLNQRTASIIGQAQVYRLANDQPTTFGFGGISHMIVNTAEGQIDTGKMMVALIQKARDLGVEIINGLGVKTLHSTAGKVELMLENNWELIASKVIVATNGFARQLLPTLAIHPARNQVLITEPIPQLKIKGCFHYDRGYYYFRNINSRILFGGGRNLAPEAEQTDHFGTTSLIKEELLKLLRTVICPDQEIQIAQWWSGILGVGPNKSPIVEEVMPGVVVAAKMGGMGIAIGSLIGEEAGEMVLGR